MKRNTPTRTEPDGFPTAHLDSFGRLMVSIAELADVAHQYAENHAALVAIERDQDHRRAA